MSNFAGGVYMNWTISGNVLITFTHQTGYNAVVSGLFFDPSSSSTSVATASLPRGDVATQRNGVETYDHPVTTEIGTVDFSSDSQAALPGGSIFTANASAPT